MSKTSILNQEDFDALLKWLAEDREKAGEKYEQVRAGLMRFFRFKGCENTEELADETINRVASKVKTFDDSKNVQTISYFYGFAANILLEHHRARGKKNVQLDTVNFVHKTELKFETKMEISEADCLETCLDQLAADEKEIVLEYYSQEKIKKIEARKELARRLNYEMNALHVKVFRLRAVLGKCIKKCLEKSL